MCRHAETAEMEQGGKAIRRLRNLGTRINVSDRADGGMTRAPGAPLAV